MAKTFDSWIAGGDRVVSSGARQIGRVRAVRGEQIYLGKLHTWVPRTAIKERRGRVLRLYPTYDYLTGPKRSRIRPSRIAMGLGLAGAFLVLRDEQRRDAILDAISGWLSKAKGRLSGGPDRMWSIQEVVQPGEEVRWRAAQGEQSPQTMPFSSLDLSERRVTDLEHEVVQLVTQSFPERKVNVNAVAVHKLKGGQVGTLRFTVDDMASSDLELSRVEKRVQPAEVLARKVIKDLGEQLVAAGVPEQPSQ